MNGLKAKFHMVGPVPRGDQMLLRLALVGEDGRIYRFDLDLETAAAIAALIEEAWGRHWLTKVHSDRSFGTPSDSPSSGKQSRHG